MKEEMQKNQNLLKQREKKLQEKEELYNNLREVVTQQQEGFTQVIYSSQRKHQEQIKTFKEQETLLIKNADDLKNRFQELQDLNNQKESEMESLKSHYSKQIHLLEQDKEGSKSYSKELEKEIMNLKKGQMMALNEKEKIWEEKAGEEISKYKKAFENLKVKSQRELNELKNEHKTHIERLCRAHEKRIRHICTEMENDLLSETKRNRSS